MSPLCSPAIAAVRAPITVLPRMVQPAAFGRAGTRTPCCRPGCPAKVTFQVPSRWTNAAPAARDAIVAVDQVASATAVQRRGPRPAHADARRGEIVVGDGVRIAALRESGSPPRRNRPPVRAHRAGAVTRGSARWRCGRARKRWIPQPLLPLDVVVGQVRLAGLQQADPVLAAPRGHTRDRGSRRARSMTPGAIAWITSRCAGSSRSGCRPFRWTRSAAGFPRGPRR